ncbi:hypothetical protein CDL15_Pgr022613 [Punica granatum]|uniref:Uncharacterized protein n=1 Tax=Punica granatum TaxID=22663 RepID=A0A218XTC2_PUNGR|nr:hypothetical protein CDL15_Pgr022613 [Punica granatum]PKI74720.1 hypothetical protein CRG98_005047 [Punica granatum]
MERFSTLYAQEGGEGRALKKKEGVPDPLGQELDPVGGGGAEERENWEHGKDVAGSRADSYLLIQSNAADVTALITVIAPISYDVTTVHCAHAACK